MKKKQWILIPALVLVAAILAACTVHTNMSYTFQVETGDNIKVKLNTEGGYSLTQEGGQFSVLREEETILQGFFVNRDMYEQYVQAAKETGTVLEDGEHGENAYLLYQFAGEAGMETNSILWVEGSDTGVVTASLSGEEAARAAFDRLTFTEEEA